MINHSSLKSENPFVAFSEDGLVDIFIGIVIIFAGFFLWVEMVWIMAVLIPAFLPTFQSIRKRLIEPRFGKLVSSTIQYAMNLKITLYGSLLMGILVLAGFLVFYMNEFVNFPENCCITAIHFTNIRYDFCKFMGFCRSDAPYPSILSLRSINSCCNNVWTICYFIIMDDLCNHGWGDNFCWSAGIAQVIKAISVTEIY